jgi:hypothetical protein
MEMIGNLFRVTSKDLDEILENSDILEDKIYAEEGEHLKDFLDLDKSWDGIFYLLTGYGMDDLERVESPLSSVLYGGEVVDKDQDVGYGPAQYITPDQVKELSNVLEPITKEDLQKKYDGEAMMKAEIYPEVWNESESLDYLLEGFEETKKFYKQAAIENKAVIFFIN